VNVAMPHFLGRKLEIKTILFLASLSIRVVPISLGSGIPQL